MKTLQKTPIHSKLATSLVVVFLLLAINHYTVAASTDTNQISSSINSEQNSNAATSGQPNLNSPKVPHDFDLQIESKVDKAQITIGDEFTYTLVVEYPKTGEIELPAVLGNLGSFEVKDYVEGNPTDSKNGRTKTYTFKLSTFTVGDYTIPPQWVEYRPDTSSQMLKSYSEPISIKVLRTSAETEKDIADLDALAPPKSLEWYWYVLIVISVVGLGFLAWYFIIKKKKAKVTEAPPLPPYEEATQSLRTLSELPVTTHGKEIALGLSEMLRRYMNRQLNIAVLEATTEEFLQRISALDVSMQIKDSLSRFCAITDPVKWASFPLSEADRSEAISICYNFLQATKPKIEDKPTPSNSTIVSSTTTSSETSATNTTHTSINTKPTSTDNGGMA